MDECTNYQINEWNEYILIKKCSNKRLSKPRKAPKTTTTITTATATTTTNSRKPTKKTTTVTTPTATTTTTTTNSSSDMSSSPSTSPLLKRTKLLSSLSQEDTNIPFIIPTETSNIRNRNKLLLLIAELRNKNVMCDVYLQCDDGSIFSAHKIILATVTPYFSAMFHSNMVENKQAVIKIQGVESSAMKSLIDFAYTTQTVVSSQNIFDVLTAANMLCFEDVEARIVQFLCEEIDLENCIDIFTVAEMINSKQLNLTANKFVANHFRQLTRNSRISDLAWHHLDSVLRNDDINVASEVDIFDAVMSWVKYDVNLRISALPQLLGHIRFALMTRKYLVDVVLREHLIMRQEECRNIVLRALDHYILPERMVVNEGDTYFVPRQLTHRALFVMGGQVNGKCQSSVECFDFKTKCWSPVTPMVHVRKHATAVVLDGNLYVVGGLYESKDLMTVEKYDPSMENWVQVASLRNCKGALAVAVVDGWIYAVGGSNGRKALKCVEQYDSMSNTWTQLSSMRLPRSNFSVCEMNGRIYAVGGYCGISEVSHCEYFDPATKKWNETTAMNKSRMNHVVVSSKNRLYVFGGKNSMGVVDSVEKYNPDLNMWLVIKSNLNISLGASICLGFQTPWKKNCGDNIIIVGGMDRKEQEQKHVKVLTLKSPEFGVLDGVPLLEKRAFSAIALL